MEKKYKKGFTLIELLAVIVILGLVLVIAIPKITQTVQNSKKRTFELTTRAIIKGAEEKYIENDTFGLEEEITCENVLGISESDFESCEILFDEVGNASVSSVGKGRYKGFYICDATKENINVSNYPCFIDVNLTIDLDGGSDHADYSQTYKGGTVLSLKKPIKGGYRFTGWTIVSGDSKVDGTNLTIGSMDTVVKATWVESNVQAIYSVTDNSLTFIDGETQVKGGTFNDKEITEVYTGFDTATYTEASSVPWYSYRSKINKIEFLNEVSPVSTAYWFYGITYCDSINLKNLDTSNVIDMSYMFYNMGYNGIGSGSEVLTLDLGEDFDTSNVTNMARMFQGTGYISEVFTLDLGDKFDTSNVTDMSNMFANTGYRSTKFTLDLGDKFDTSNVNDMLEMFYYTGYNSTVLTLDLGDKFDTSNITDMSMMFYYTGYNSAEFTLDLGDRFDTSNVTDMSYMFYNMGYNSTKLSLDLGDKFDTSNVTNMTRMFNDVGLRSPIFTLDLGDKFDTSNVTNMGFMFEGVGYNNTKFTLDLGDKFDTSNVTDMQYMFERVGGNSIEFTLDLGDKFDTSNVTEMRSMFYFTAEYSTKFILDLGDKFDTSNATGKNTMYRVFAYAGKNSTEFILDLGDKFKFLSAESAKEFARGCGAKKLIIPSTITNIPAGAFQEMNNLSEIVFEHTNTNTITLPTAGSSTGAFYIDTSINTKVTTTNDIIKNYDWAADNRAATFNLQ